MPFFHDPEGRLHARRTFVFIAALVLLGQGVENPLQQLSWRQHRPDLALRGQINQRLLQGRVQRVTAGAPGLPLTIFPDQDFTVLHPVHGHVHIGRLVPFDQTGG